MFNCKKGDQASTFFNKCLSNCPGGLTLLPELCKPLCLSFGFLKLICSKKECLTKEQIRLKNRRHQLVRR